MANEVRAQKDPCSPNRSGRARKLLGGIAYEGLRGLSSGLEVFLPAYRIEKLQTGKLGKYYPVGISSASLMSRIACPFFEIRSELSSLELHDGMKAGPSVHAFKMGSVCRANI